MPLEATMICLDNSEWMRNGDFVPSRMESQKDAINMLFGSKLNSHPENTVGLISMAEKYYCLFVCLFSSKCIFYLSVNNSALNFRPTH